MATAPTIATKAAGNRLRATDWNSVVTAYNFLLNPPAAMAYRNTTASAANNTDTLVTYDSEDYDRYAIHASGSSDMVISHDGRWDVRVRHTFASNATGARRVECRLNAGGVIGGGSLMARANESAVNGDVCTLEMNWSRNFATGDILQCFAWQSSGGSLAYDFGIRKCMIELKFVGTN